ncbi:hypothetical protein vseg_015723 [Gypsophila vaccaria]
MLSFCNKQEIVGFLCNDDDELRLLSECNGFTSSFGHMNGGMHGSLTGVGGPFTPAQWIELEHQAMIYKYFTANVPVPSNLLIPIKKAIQSAVFPGFSIGSYPSHSYGWGSFHLGFSGNTDPEPGRCRRTDGKKWRCSRDAVPDQKYCDRHINRGRHRSRKPVEGHTGQAASGTATTKAVLPAVSASMPSLVASGGGVSSGNATVQHQIKGLQPAGATNASIDPLSKCLTDQQGLSVMSTTMNVEFKDSQSSVPKQHISYDEPSVSEFGIVSNDSLLNPSQKCSYLDCKSYNSLLEFNTGQNRDQYSLRHFTENWRTDQPHVSAIPWPKDLKSDWTQLSMSLPTLKDFSLSSTNQDKIDGSPLRLSHEPKPSQMGLGVGTIVAEGGTNRNTWIPIAQGNSMGGPLGEVLLNNTSPKLASLPRGVLQESTFASHSRTSSGGSPRAEMNKTVEGASLCDDLLGLAAHATCASIPSM